MRMIIAVFFVSFSAMHYSLLASNDPSIRIDNNRHQLMAPDGSRYEWYLDGKLLIKDIQFITPCRSGLYRVVMTDEQGIKKTGAIMIALKNGTIHKIYIIGDSTVADYSDSYYPQKGWGQVFGLFFDNTRVQIVNKAIGGRSSRSFYEQGRWTEVVNLLDSGDYVFVQFGHNDRDASKPERYTDTAAFKDYLRIYVNETRAKGATPVLVSPMIMNAYNGATLRNVFTEGINDYRGAMAQVARELSAPFVDLNMKSFNRIKEVGREYASYFIFLGLLPGEYPNFPEGSADVQTHFQEMGALEMANLIMQGILELSADTNMTYLINAMRQKYQLNPSLNINEAGLVTQPGKYPEGAPLTIKTRLKAGYTFNHWEEEDSLILSADNLVRFTMDAHGSDFIASISDCNGITGGLATLDDCGSCSGGTTGITPCIMAFQSENACMYDGVPESQTINNIKRTYINTEAYCTPSVTYSISAVTDTIYFFGLVYFTNDSMETLDILVNGDTVIYSLKLDSTGNWNIASIELNLKQGNNIVKTVSQSTSGGILFDLLAVYSTGLSRGSTCKITELVLSDREGFWVYPNPSKRGFEIRTQGLFDYRIYNALGVLLTHGTGENIAYVGEELHNGFYLLQIYHNFLNTTIPIIKTQ